MRKKTILYIAAIVVAILSITSVVMAQTSANFDLFWHNNAAGGGQRQSASFAIQDSVGQMTAGTTTSANNQILAGFVQPLVAAGADQYEDDNSCGAATPIDTQATKQQHNFNVGGDQDWLRFTAKANKTYLIQVNNLGAKADAVILLQEACDHSPLSYGRNSFGSAVTLEWDSTKNGDYFIQLQQFDPTFFGDSANYEVSVKEDSVPPSAPQNLRCISVNATTIGVQWKKNLERDVRQYRVSYAGNVSGNKDVPGAASTYYEVSGLTPNQNYALRVQAVDYSGNASTQSDAVSCTAKVPTDSTQPTLTLSNPAASSTYSTTASLLTFSGQALDSGGNLSRVQLTNQTAAFEKWDYSLTGGNHIFRIPDVKLNLGDNTIKLKVFDAAGNSTQRDLTVRRLGQVAGAVIIIAGHNDTNALQTNIYNAANRAYRIFRSAGYTDEDIYYLAPVAQDVDGTGGNQVDATSSPAALENAIKNWAKQNGRVGKGKPLFIYMIDHGFAEKFCASGCDSAAGQTVTPALMDSWLRQLEQQTGVDQVTIMIEACQSGSFIDRVNGDGSLSKAGRVIITATGRNNNAYASADGAYFSDAFFSCLADSYNLKACYNQGVQAVQGTGVDQTPWMDDNGDGVSSASDGAIAQQIVLTRFYSTIPPKIGPVSVSRSGANASFSAQIEEGAEEVEVVWAAVYPPSFVEPTDVTLNPDVPAVRLELDPNQEGHYTFNDVNGFTEEGDYRVIFYAQDRLDINAVPKREGQLTPYFMPFIKR